MGWLTFYGLLLTNRAFKKNVFALFVTSFVHNVAATVSQKEIRVPCEDPAMRG
jgi:hypothetical protein